jgi:hypothetical protein
MQSNGNGNQHQKYQQKSSPGGALYSEDAAPERSF